MRNGLLGLCAGGAPGAESSANLHLRRLHLPHGRGGGRPGRAGADGFRRYPAAFRSAHVEEVSAPVQGGVLWGGLGGSVDLAVALAVLAHRALAAAIQDRYGVVLEKKCDIRGAPPG